jgi:hypothetical protein
MNEEPIHRCAESRVAEKRAYAPPRLHVLTSVEADGKTIPIPTEGVTATGVGNVRFGS